MFITIINDCKDANAFGRQATRASILLNAPVTGVGVEFGSTLEGAGNLIDILDASEGQKGVVLVNLAPRHGNGKKWENGTPFCYFYYGETLVISTIAEYALSLVKKLHVASQVQLVDLPTVVNSVIKQKILAKDIGDRIITTQFRSFDFTPRLAKWLWDGVKIPFQTYSLHEVSDAPKAVWLADNFGNCKTTILPKEVDFEAGKVIETKIGPLTCYNFLKDVPNGASAIIQGSSGIGSKRFLEIVVQGQSAAEKFNLKSGSLL